MPKFKMKPVQVEARQWDGSAANALELVAWVQAGGMLAFYDTSLFPDALYIVINTRNGPLHASPKDWLMRGVDRKTADGEVIKGEFSVYKPDVFAACSDPT